MNVLSLFDGMSCGQLALHRAGIKYNKYYVSEIDKYAIEITQKNFPETVQLGDIKSVRASDLLSIDLLMAGSPCQGFSFAGKQLAFDDPRSQLFFEFVRLLRECKPKYFILENVRMKKEFLDIISQHVGVEPILINSALVCAQNRQRYYWTNIPNVGQPSDRGILLKDIVEDGSVDRDKSYCLDSSYWKGTSPEIYYNRGRRQLVFCSRMVGRYLVNGKRQDHKHSVAGMTTQRLEPRFDGKTNCLTTVTKDNLVCRQVASAIDIKGHEILRRIYSLEHKAPTLNSMNGGNRHPKVVNKINYRKLTPKECERLQTVPDDYTAGVSNTQRYKMLGNGWTVDVISHILQGIKE